MNESSATHAHILIVDDEEAVRESIADVLTDAGYAVSTAATVQEAYTWLTASPPVCLILLDLMMPHLDGAAFMGLKQQTALLRDRAVVVLSAAENGAQKAVELNAQGFLKKPVRMKALLASASQFCAHPANAAHGQRVPYER